MPSLELMVIVHMYIEIFWGIFIEHMNLKIVEALFRFLTDCNCFLIIVDNFLEPQLSQIISVSKQVQLNRKDFRVNSLN